MLRTKPARKPNRSHQPRLVKELARKCRKNGFAYLWSATASGKSKMFLLTSQKLAGQAPRICILAHTLNCVKQNFVSACRQFLGMSTAEARKLIPDTEQGWLRYKNILSCTWQGLSLYARNNSIKLLGLPKHFDVLVIDEVHCGTKGFDSKSIKACRQLLKARYELYVTATAENIHDDHLRGPLNDDTMVFYPMVQAIRDGAINPVNLHVFYSGMEIHARRLEKVTGKSVDDFIEQRVYRASLKDPTKQAEELEAARVDEEQAWEKFFVARVTSGMRAICAGEAQHFRRPKWQLQVFTPNQKDAEIALPIVRGTLRKAFEKQGLPFVGDDVVRVIHSGPGGGGQERLQEFIDGTFRVAIVVGMGLEAMDIPTLEVGLDLAFNFQNTERFKQKLGRLVRLPDDTYKAESRMYVVVDAMFFLRYRGRKLKTEVLEEKLGGSNSGQRSGIAGLMIREMLWDSPGIKGAKEEIGLGGGIKKYDPTCRLSIPDGDPNDSLAMYPLVIDEVRGHGAIETIEVTTIIEQREVDFELKWSLLEDHYKKHHTAVRSDDKQLRAFEGNVSTNHPQRLAILRKRYKVTTKYDTCKRKRMDLESFYAKNRKHPSPTKHPQLYKFETGLRGYRLPELKALWRKHGILTRDERKAQNWADLENHYKSHHRPAPQRGPSKYLGVFESSCLSGRSLNGADRRRILKLRHTHNVISGSQSCALRAAERAWPVVRSDGAQFRSATEAAKENGVQRTAIVRAIGSGGHSGGFRWRYAN